MARRGVNSHSERGIGAAKNDLVRGGAGLVLDWCDMEQVDVVDRSFGQRGGG